MIAHIGKFAARVLGTGYASGGEITYDEVLAATPPITKDTNVTETPLVFIDTETTGTHPDRRPWEIAMIRRENGIDTRIVIQISDVDLSHAQPKGLEVGGFYKRHRSYATASEWKDGVLFYRENLAAVAVEKWTRGAHLIGVNPAFDDKTLDAMLRRHNLIPAWHYHVIDVSAMGLGYLRGLADHGHSSISCAPFSTSSANVETIAPPYKSDQIAAACGVPPLPDHLRHTALGDATWAMQWYDIVMNSAQGWAPAGDGGAIALANMAVFAQHAGVKPGKDLIRYLGIVTYVAASIGLPLEEIARFFNKVQTMGRANTADVNQLADRGLPIWVWLAIELKMTQSHTKRLVSEGKVDTGKFLLAIENNIGVAA